MEFSKGIAAKLLPAATAFILFFVVSAAYFAPQFRGEVLPQHDVMQYDGMTKDINDQRAQTGEDPQWTGGMFGGMPAYLINVAYPAQLVKNTVGKVVKLIDTPAGFLFFAMVSMWLMLLIVGVNPWIGIIASLAYGLSTYFLLIIGAGHVTKMWALVYAPLMMGGAWMTLRGSIWLGAALTALTASLEIGANHPQITYYFLLAMAAFWISEGVVAIREKHLKPFALRTAALIAAGLLAVGSNFSPLWYTAQHSKETIRGGSELAAATESSPRGLDLTYATAWSYGRAETFNLLVPDFMGRDSATPLPTDGETGDLLQRYGYNRQAAGQFPAYWGNQPYTGGPTYLGAAAIFLAALGIALARGRNKWWIIAVSVLMILLAWGQNLMGFTEFAFKYLPGYNKFRTVSMTLVVVQWAVPLLGALALMRLWRDEISRKQLLNALAWTVGITGGICLIFALAGGSIFGFGAQETSTMLVSQGLPEAEGLQLAQAMAADRAHMMEADAWRSLLMILLSAGSVALFAFGKINKYLLTGALGIVILLDLVPVDLRFLSHDNFVSARRQQITATIADEQIHFDKDPSYRVLNLTVSPFNDATTSYLHRSVGGYHGAKLARYQDLIDAYMSDRNGNGRLEINDMHPGVLDMLNTRYVILPGVDGQPAAARRETANGAAWFVDSVVYAPSAQQEIELLGGIDTKTTAVVKQGTAVSILGAGEISLTEYRPNYLKYEYTSPEGGVAVFSEIFYDKGWKAFVDGVEAPYFRADYVLRAMELPAGTHSVEWRFRAPGWTAAEAVTMTSSIVILLGALAALGSLFFCRKRKQN